MKDFRLFGLIALIGCLLAAPILAAQNNKYCVQKLDVYGTLTTSFDAEIVIIDHTTVTAQLKTVHNLFKRCDKAHTLEIKSFKPKYALDNSWDIEFPESITMLSLENCLISEDELFKLLEKNKNITSLKLQRIQHPQKGDYWTWSTLKLPKQITKLDIDRVTQSSLDHILTSLPQLAQLTCTKTSTTTIETLKLSKNTTFEQVFIDQAMDIADIFGDENEKSTPIAIEFSSKEKRDAYQAKTQEQNINKKTRKLTYVGEHSLKELISSYRLPITFVIGGTAVALGGFFAWKYFTAKKSSTNPLSPLKSINSQLRNITNTQKATR